MTQPTVEGFFAGTVRNGAPSALLKSVNDLVFGEVTDQFLTDYKDFTTGQPVLDTRTGKNEQQLVIVVQTEYRNWDNVATIPDVDPNDLSKGKKDPSLDDGRRAIYVRAGHNLHYAIGRALSDQGLDPNDGVRNGSKFGVKIFNLKPTGKGNPLKEHQVHYVAPVASGGEFFQAPAQQAAPVVTAQQEVAPGRDPWVASPQQSGAGAPAQQDPWASQPAATETEAPPF